MLHFAVQLLLPVGCCTLEVCVPVKNVGHVSPLEGETHTSIDYKDRIQNKQTTTTTKQVIYIYYKVSNITTNS